MSNIQLRNIPVGLVVCTLLAALSSCGPDKDKEADNLRNATFKRLNDSIRSFSPQADALSDSLIKTAPDSESYYGYVVLRGCWYLNANNLDSALLCARRTRQFAQRQAITPYVHTLFAFSNSLEGACYHLMRQNARLALKLNMESVKHIMQSDQISLAPNMAANVADSYVFLNDIPQAAKWYRRALFLADSLKLPDTYSLSLYMGLGQIYTTLEDFKSAKHYYELTNKQFDKLQPKMQAYFLNNYGNYFYFTGDYKQALRIFLRLHSHILKYYGDENFNMYICKINLADTYLNLGQTDEAEKYVNKTLPYFQKMRVNDGVFYANTIKIGIALKRKRYADIKRILDNEPPIKRIDQNIANIRNRYITDYYAQTGNYKKAFEVMVAHKAQVDSAEHNKQNMRASEIMQRFTEDTIKLHYELELHERDAIVSKSRATLWGLVSLVILLVSTIITTVFYQRKRKLQTDLDMFVLRLATIRQRISPHFVFNVINAKIGKAPKDESDVLVNMAKLIRQNLELTGHTYVKLSEELSFVSRYVELQRTLLDNNLNFVLHQPERPITDSILIPSMFVQILVENAIKHGLKAIEGPKRLEIDVAYSANGVTITVTDNGPGFDIRRSNPDSTKTGLYVIRHTMAVMNKNNKACARMKLAIHNLEMPDGHIRGCQSTLFIPNKMKMI